MLSQTENSFRLVLCNIGEAHAEALAKSLVQEHLAACVNILPKIKSFYHWQGQLCEGQEATLLIKTLVHKMPQLTERIKKLHPDQVPEVIAFEIKNNEGNKDYLTWLSSELKG